MKPIEEIISKNIKKILKDYNLNQNELAKIAGVSESTVGKWVLEKSSPRMGAIQKISDYFGLPKSYILNEDKSDVVKETQYPYYPSSISAGAPLDVDGITKSDIKKIHMPDNLMGKWAGNKDIKIMRVNGDSMNKVMPHNSIIAVKQVELYELKDGDIVVYSDDHNYSVKRFYKNDERLLFRPDSTDKGFVDHIVPIKDSNNLLIHGKVVLYIVELD